MKIVRSARLWFKQGTSDKLYEADLVDTESPDASQRFLVNFRFGRRRPDSAGRRGETSGTRGPRGGGEAVRQRHRRQG